MTPERWQQIRDVLEQALELAPGERSAFLNQACASDPSLRQEVETLLASSDDVRSGFLQSVPLRVPLTSGTKLGGYEVKSLLGAGGMGEVYRAREQGSGVMWRLRFCRRYSLLIPSGCDASSIHLAVENLSWSTIDITQSPNLELHPRASWPA